MSAYNWQRDQDQRWAAFWEDAQARVERGRQFDRVWALLNQLQMPRRFYDLLWHRGDLYDAWQVGGTYEGMTPEEVAGAVLGEFLHARPGLQPLWDVVDHYRLYDVVNAPIETVLLDEDTEEV